MRKRGGLWPESKRKRFDPLNLMQIMLTQENMENAESFRGEKLYDVFFMLPVRLHWFFPYRYKTGWRMK